jgi:hypothetical protein
MIIKKFFGNISKAAGLLPLGMKLVKQLELLGLSSLRRTYAQGNVEVRRVGGNTYLYICGVGFIPDILLLYGKYVVYGQSFESQEDQKPLVYLSLVPPSVDRANYKGDKDVLVSKSTIQSFPTSGVDGPEPHTLRHISYYENGEVDVFRVPYITRLSMPTMFETQYKGKAVLFDRVYFGASQPSARAIMSNGFHSIDVQVLGRLNTVSGHYMLHAAALEDAINDAFGFTVVSGNVVGEYVPYTASDINFWDDGGTALAYGLLLLAPMLQFDILCSDANTRYSSTYYEDVPWDMHNEPIKEEGDVYWPQKTYSYFDRAFLLSADGQNILNSKIYSFGDGQPALTRAIIYSNPFVVDTFSSTYIQTNYYGFKKRVGKIVIWEKNIGQYKDLPLGTFVKKNTGISLQDVVTDFGEGNPEYSANSQLVSAQSLLDLRENILFSDEADMYYWTSNTLIFEPVCSCQIYASSTRYYITVMETAFSDWDNHWVGIVSVSKAAPDTVEAGPIWLSSVDGFEQWKWFGYIDDPNGAYSGVSEVMYAIQQSVYQYLYAPSFSFIVASESLGGLLNTSARESHYIEDAFSLFNIQNPNFIGLKQHVNSMCPELTSFIYRGKLVCIASLTYDSSNQEIPSTSAPTGLFSFDLLTREVELVIGGEIEGLFFHVDRVSPVKEKGKVLLTCIKLERDRAVINSDLRFYILVDVMSGSTKIYKKEFASGPFAVLLDKK